MKSSRFRNLRFPIILALTVVLFAALFAHTGAQQSGFRSNVALARDVIAELNAWRLSAGLNPLKPNDELTELAKQQAEYVLSLPSIPQGGDIHLGPNKEQPSQRAAAAPYNWTAYGAPNRVAVNEIAVVGSVPAFQSGSSFFAIQWWRASELHTRAITNPAYREIGAAAVIGERSVVIMVELAARPDVLPALYNPQDDQLYLSADRYLFGSGSDPWIQAPTSYLLLNSEGEPFSRAWQPWMGTVKLPAHIPRDSVLFVLYRDDLNRVALSEVDLSHDWVLLPGSAPSVEASPTPEAIVQVATPTPQPTAAPTVPPTLTPAVIPDTPTPSQPPNLVFIYDSQSFALVNIAGRRLDVSQLRLRSAGSDFSVSYWQTVVSDLALDALPDGYCLQVWSWSNPDVLSAPSQCRVRYGVVTIAPDRFFWTQGVFEVRHGERLLTTCDAAASACPSAPTTLSCCSDRGINPLCSPCILILSLY